MSECKNKYNRIAGFYKLSRETQYADRLQKEYIGDAIKSYINANMILYVMKLKRDTEATLKFFEKLLDQYHYESDGILSLEGARIIKPIDIKDLNVLRMEYLDLILPYLIMDRGKFDERTCQFVREGPYEYKNVKIGQGDVVIDCGANIGLFSAFASNRYQAYVYAFEPNKDLIDIYTQKTGELNNNIKIMPFAVGNDIGTLEFEIFLNRSSGSRIFNKDMKSGAATKRVEVLSTTLDEFANNYNISKIDFIKADIEGAERYMLRGAKHVLREMAPKLAICKYHLPDDPEVLKEIILAANPNYIIEEQWMKLFAYVPR